MAPDKRAELISLYREFASSYASTPEAQRYMDLLDEGQRQARKNFREITQAADRGEDVTEQVLLKFLPHTDSDAHRQKGAWIYFAWSTEQEDWSPRPGWHRSQLAGAILHFVRCCNDQPKELLSTCAEFSKTPYCKDLHTGLLSPILNALRPDDFLLIDGNCLRLINYFTNTSSSLSLTDYPAANASGHGLDQEVVEEVRQTNRPEIKKVDSFAIFLQWLTIAKKYGLNARFLIHPEMYKHWPPMW